MPKEDETRARSRRPPVATLQWAARAVGSGSRVVSYRRLPLGSWHANHLLTIEERSGASHRLVLRRWARPGWETNDPDLTAHREMVVLGMLQPTPVPAPTIVAADPDACVCDVPTLLLTRLPGHPPGTGEGGRRFVATLADALAVIHEVHGGARDRIPRYRRYHELHRLAPPAWSRRPALWTRALDLARRPPPRRRACFIHRDYHPENTLWSRGRLTGIVDWTSASWGPPSIDVGHMRWNLAVAHGLELADDFLAAWHAVGGDAADQGYWDAAAILDVMPDIAPDQRRATEELLERAIAGGG